MPFTKFHILLLFLTISKENFVRLFYPNKEAKRKLFLKKQYLHLNSTFSYIKIGRTNVLPRKYND